MSYVFDSPSDTRILRKFLAIRCRPTWRLRYLDRRRMSAGDWGGGCHAPLHVKRSTATYVITEHPTCAVGQRYMCSGPALHVQQASATCAAEHRCIWQCYMCSRAPLHMAAL